MAVTGHFAYGTLCLLIGHFAYWTIRLIFGQFAYWTLRLLKLETSCKLGKERPLWNLKREFLSAWEHAEAASAKSGRPHMWNDEGNREKTLYR